MQSAQTGGSATAMSTKPVPTESAAGIELVRATESVAAAEVEALGPQVEGEFGYGRVYCPRK